MSSDVEQLSALCKDAFYAARDAGRTMHQAGDDAAKSILASDWLTTHVAAAVAEGRKAALLEAADALENPGHTVNDIPRHRLGKWLQLRAEAGESGE